jgi:hypothetical protein
MMASGNTNQYRAAVHRRVAVRAPPRRADARTCVCMRTHARIHAHVRARVRARAAVRAPAAARHDLGGKEATHVH